MIQCARRYWRDQCHDGIPACCAGVLYSTPAQQASENMGYSKWEFPKYFLGNNFNITITGRTHTVLSGFSVANVCHINTFRMNFHIRACWHIVFDVHTSYLWRDRRYQVHFSLNSLAGIVGPFSSTFFCFLRSLVLKDFADFWQLYYWGCLKIALLSMTQRLWFHHDGVPVHSWKDMQKRLNAT